MARKCARDRAENASRARGWYVEQLLLEGTDTALEDALKEVAATPRLQAGIDTRLIRFRDRPARPWRRQ